MKSRAVENFWVSKIIDSGYNKSCIRFRAASTLAPMVLRVPRPEMAELHFEGDSKEALSAFPDSIKASLSFSLREIQTGRPPVCETRSMKSIGQGVFELKESDERAWYRVIYLTKIGKTIYVLHCFEKDSRKTGKNDIAIASQRLKQVRLRLRE